MGFGADDATHAALLEFAQELYLPDEDVIRGGADAAVEKLSNMPTPEYIFVDLSDAGSPLEQLDKLSGVCDPGTQVVAIGAVNDISLYRAVVAAGVADYLVKPVTPDMLKQAYERAHQIAEAPAAQPGAVKTSADVIVTVGTRGGVGASMVATNMAWLLAHENAKKVALVDLDPYYGNAAMILNLEPGRGLSEALEAPDRIDKVFIERTMIKQHDNLLVLGAEESMQNDVPLDAGSIELLLEKLRDEFQVLMVDAPRGNMPAIKAAMRMATHILLVSDYSVVGMRDAIRLSGLANSLAAGTKQFVLTNLGVVGKTDVNAKDFEATTGIAVNSEIPSDTKGVAAALNAGEPLPVGASKSPVVRTLRAFCTALYAPADSADKKASFLGAFMGKKAS